MVSNRSFFYYIKGKMESLANAKNTQLRKFDFEYGFRPVYYFLRFTGLWPFSIIHHSNGKIQRARIGSTDILWLILITCLNLILAFFAIEILMSEQGIQEKRNQFILFSIFKMCSVLFEIFAIVLDIINRNKLVDILRKFNTFDNEVSIFFFTEFFIFNSNEV